MEKITKRFIDFIMEHKKERNSEIRKIAILQPSFSVGGATAVAVWAIEALKDAYKLTLITTEPIDIERINDFYGTNLRETDFQIRLVPRLGMFRKYVPDGFLLKVHLLQRYYKQHSNEFDLVFSTRCEMDFGERGIQYIHMPVWNDEPLRQIGQMPKPDKWIQQKSFLRKAYKFGCAVLSGWSEERMKQNVTLVNSNWTSDLVGDVYGIKSQVVYPPVFADFPSNSWEEREDGFVCIGAVTPIKKIETIVEIISEVRRVNPRVHLHIIGLETNSEYGLKIDRLCAERSPWLFWEKKLSREELITLVAKHKYGIHGMRNEHFGIAVAEMVNAGCITFIPETGGQVEIVRDKRLIYKDIDDCVQKIIAVLASSSDQEMLRKQLHLQSHKFSLEAFVQAIRTIVKRKVAG